MRKPESPVISPGDLRLPAEWEPHRATWLSWPHDRSLSWPGEDNRRIIGPMLRFVSLLTAGEEVFINIPPGFERDRITDRVDRAERLRFFEIPTDDPWCRDHGPVFLARPEGPPVAVVWRFNSWGNKYSHENDALAARRMAEAIGVDFVERDLTLEGGGFETNGAGLLIASRRSVINENRNPAVAPGAIEEEIRRWFRAHDIIWVDAEIPGDDTDGHVDNIARFTAAQRLLAVAPSRMRTDSDRSLADNLRALQRECSRRGLELIELPMPRHAPVHDGQAMPASYANFYVANELVIVPVYGDDNDDRACEIVSAQFPGRRIEPFDARELILGQGACHCVSCQVPMA